MEFSWIFSEFILFLDFPDFLFLFIFAFFIFLSPTLLLTCMCMCMFDLVVRPGDVRTGPKSKPNQYYIPFFIVSLSPIHLPPLIAGSVSSLQPKTIDINSLYVSFPFSSSVSANSIPFEPLQSHNHRANNPVLSMPSLRSPINAPTAISSVSKLNRNCRRLCFIAFPTIRLTVEAINWHATSSSTSLHSL